MFLMHRVWAVGRVLADMPAARVLPAMASHAVRSAASATIAATTVPRAATVIVPAIRSDAATTATAVNHR